MIPMNADLECELRELDNLEERQEYMEAMGLPNRLSIR